MVGAATERSEHMLSFSVWQQRGTTAIARGYVGSTCFWGTLGDVVVDLYAHFVYIHLSKYVIRQYSWRVCRLRQVVVQSLRRDGSPLLLCVLLLGDMHDDGAIVVCAIRGVTKRFR